MFFYNISTAGYFGSIIFSSHCQQRVSIFVVTTFNSSNKLGLLKKSCAWSWSIGSNNLHLKSHLGKPSEHIWWWGREVGVLQASHQGMVWYFTLCTGVWQASHQGMVWCLTSSTATVSMQRASASHPHQ
jgi:hypothetical protein